MLPQHSNDLILTKSASPHHSSPDDELTYQWHDFWGAGHKAKPLRYARRALLGVTDAEAGAMLDMLLCHLTRLP